jgi:hypothetical protein
MDDGGGGTTPATGGRNPFGPVIGVLQGMVERGEFVVCTERPLSYLTPRLLHALVAEKCCALGVACSPGNAEEEAALKAAMLGLLGGQGVEFVGSLQHRVRGQKKGVLVRVRPAGIPESWFRNKEEELPAAFKDAATLPLTVRCGLQQRIIGRGGLAALRLTFGSRKQIRVLAAMTPHSVSHRKPSPSPPETPKRPRLEETEGAMQVRI